MVAGLNDISLRNRDIRRSIVNQIKEGQKKVIKKTRIAPLVFRNEAENTQQKPNRWATNNFDGAIPDNAKRKRLAFEDEYKMFIKEPVQKKTPMQSAGMGDQDQELREALQVEWLERLPSDEGQLLLNMLVSLGTHQVDRYYLHALKIVFIVFDGLSHDAILEKLPSMMKYALSKVLTRMSLEGLKKVYIDYPVRLDENERIECWKQRIELFDGIETGIESLEVKLCDGWPKVDLTLLRSRIPHLVCGSRHVRNFSQEFAPSRSRAACVFQTPLLPIREIEFLRFILSGVLQRQGRCLSDSENLITEMKSEREEWNEIAQRLKTLTERISTDINEDCAMEEMGNQQLIGDDGERKQIVKGTEPAPRQIGSETAMERCRKIIRKHESVLQRLKEEHNSEVGKLKKEKEVEHNIAKALTKLIEGLGKETREDSATKDAVSQASEKEDDTGELEHVNSNPLVEGCEKLIQDYKLEVKKVKEKVEEKANTLIMILEGFGKGTNEASDRQASEYALIDADSDTEEDQNTGGMDPEVEKVRKKVKEQESRVQGLDSRIEELTLKQQETETELCKVKKKNEELNIKYTSMKESTITEIQARDQWREELEDLQRNVSIFGEAVASQEAGMVTEKIALEAVRNKLSIEQDMPNQPVAEATERPRENTEPRNGFGLIKSHSGSWNHYSTQDLGLVSHVRVDIAPKQTLNKIWQNFALQQRRNKELSETIANLMKYQHRLEQQEKSLKEKIIDLQRNFPKLPPVAMSNQLSEPGAEDILNCPPNNRSWPIDLQNDGNIALQSLETISEGIKVLISALDGEQTRRNGLEEENKELSESKVKLEQENLDLNEKARTLEDDLKGFEQLYRWYIDKESLGHDECFLRKKFHDHFERLKTLKERMVSLQRNIQSLNDNNTSEWERCHAWLLAKIGNCRNELRIAANTAGEQGTSPMDLSDESCVPFTKLESISEGFELLSFELKGGIEKLKYPGLLPVHVSTQTTPSETVEKKEFYRAQGAMRGKDADDREAKSNVIAALEEKETELKDVENRVQELHLKVKNQDTEIKCKENEVRALKKTVDDKKKEFDSKIAENTSNCNMITALRETAKKNAQKHQQRVDELEGILKQEKKGREELESDLKEGKAKIEELQHRLSVLEAEKELLVKTSAEEIEEKTTMIKSKQEVINKLEKDFSTLQKTLDGKIEELQEKEAEMKMKQEVINSLSVENTAEEQRKGRHVEEVPSALNGEFKKGQEKIAILMETLGRREKEVENLEMQLSAEREKLEEKDRDINKKTETISRLHEDLEAKGDINDLREAVSQLEEKIHEQMKKLNQEQSRTREEFEKQNQLKHHNNHQEKQIGGLEKQLATLNQEFDNLQAALSKKEEELEEKSVLEDKMKKGQEEVRELNKQLIGRYNDNERLRGELSLREEELRKQQQLDEKVEETKKTMQNLQQGISSEFALVRSTLNELKAKPLADRDQAPGLDAVFTSLASFQSTLNGRGEKLRDLGQKVNIMESLLERSVHNHAESEISALRSKVIALEQIIPLQRELGIAHASFDKARAENAKMNTEMEESKDRLRNVQAERAGLNISALAEQVNDSNTTLKNFLARYTQHFDNWETLQNEVNGLRSELNAIGDKVDDYTTELQLAGIPLPRTFATSHMGLRANKEDGRIMKKLNFLATWTIDRIHEMKEEAEIDKLRIIMAVDNNKTNTRVFCEDTNRSTAATPPSEQDVTFFTPEKNRTERCRIDDLINMSQRSDSMGEGQLGQGKNSLSPYPLLPDSPAKKSIATQTNFRSTFSEPKKHLAAKSHDQTDKSNTIRMEAINVKEKVEGSFSDAERFRLSVLHQLCAAWKSGKIRDDVKPTLKFQHIHKQNKIWLKKLDETFKKKGRGPLKMPSKKSLQEVLGVIGIEGQRVFPGPSLDIYIIIFQALVRLMAGSSDGDRITDEGIRRRRLLSEAEPTAEETSNKSLRRSKRVIKNEEVRGKIFVYDTLKQCVIKRNQNK